MLIFTAACDFSEYQCIAFNLVTSIVIFKLETNMKRKYTGLQLAKLPYTVCFVIMWRNYIQSLQYTSYMLRKMRV